MISPTTTPQYYGTSGTTDTGPKQSLDKDAFLTLLVAQLKHQDPTSPLQPHELAAQLAQFTSVEQLTQLNDAMTAQTEAAHMAMLVGQTSLSTSLIGRQVLALGDQVTIPSSGSASIHLEVGGSGGAGTLQLLNDEGAIVATRDLGQLNGGAIDVTLPADLPPGTWHYKVVAKANDKDVSVTTFTKGVVSSVEFKNGSIVLHVGKMDITLDDLVQIEPSTTPGSGGSSGDSGGGTSGSSGTITTPPPGGSDSGDPSMDGSGDTATVLERLQRSNGR